MRFWAKLFCENHMIKDTVTENTSDDTRTHKVFDAIDRICYEFDLSRPIWLDSNITDFKKYSKVRFYKDSFVEDITFDYLEFSVLEED